MIVLVIKYPVMIKQAFY